MSHLQKLNAVTEPVRYLRKIRKFLPDAIIAGGYYRDIYHNITFNDVDIFVSTDQSTSPKPKYSTPNSFNEEFWVNIFNMDGDDDYIEDVTSESEDYEDDNIGAVFELVCNSIKYNVIVLPDMDPISFVDEQFDFGICKIYGDGNKVSLSAEFLHDSRHKVLTLTNKPITYESFCRSMTKHLSKLKKKFTGYSVKIPTRHLSHLATSKITL